MKNIPFEAYFKKVKGCYCGKAVGGTLGMPFEGNLNTQQLTYYHCIPDTMLPNDDIDLQVIYAETLFRNGLPVNRHHLAKAWEHMRFGPDEYGITKHHLALGLYPPASGAYENAFARGMGAAIRSELWACMAPGDPELAVAFAREDACIDHREAGIDAAVFLTALQSAAFVCSDREKLLETAFSFIPKDCILSLVLHDVLKWWEQTPEPSKVRELILQKYDVVNWTDVTINLSFILLGWLNGGNDFGKAICTTVNCGYDTDCTGATLGALLGIIDPDSIDKKWKDPIGNSLVLSCNIVGAHNPNSIDGFSEQASALAYRALSYYERDVQIKNVPEHIVKMSESIKLNTPFRSLVTLHSTERDSLFCVSPLMLTLRYPEKIAADTSGTCEYTLFISNPNESTAEGSVKLSSVVGQINNRAFNFKLNGGETAQFTFDFSPHTSRCGCLDRFDLQFCVNGLSFEAFAPIIRSIPWREANTGLLSPSKGYIKSIPAGEQRYTVDFNLPNNIELAVSCVCTRNIRLYINGELIKEGSTASAVPSVHRGSSTDVQLPRGNNRALIEIDDGPTGEFFFALGDLDNWIWYDFIDWSVAE